ncbi:hypothetical protein RE6C_03303 [Rhodopirellula europaea 6C]|uniref:Uncharacterized protein n=2 Tax=Rhodopirellula TaxID=265488 RepID=M2A634_9BACT|nr:hypothetical protein RBSWK_06385 [Rhodopirellula baltica SWK14]EMB15956.1 hypothetical protein RE6C_03303 [Rhodopirellula europaea 6C]
MSVWAWQNPRSLWIRDSTVPSSIKNFEKPQARPIHAIASKTSSRLASQLNLVYRVS